MRALAAVLLAGWAFGQSKGGIHSIPLTDIDGKPVTLAPYKGRPILIVNTASKCGLTPQYKGLQALHEDYGPRGLVVLGVPSNDFKGQEPGSEAEIKRFCELNYRVTFPMLSKMAVLGKNKHPLYRWLIDNSPEKGEVRWNFEKFLIDAEGRVAARFAPAVRPESAELVAAVEKLLR